MDHWFVDTYHGDTWNNETERRYGYGQKFLNTVAHIRNWFGLWPTSDGREVAKEWAHYTLGLLGNNGKKLGVDVYVHDFAFPYFDKDETGRPFLRFFLDVKLRWSDTKKVFADKEISIEFPHRYPIKPPRFYTYDYIQYDGSHDHHTMSGGQYCILTEGRDWHKGDTIVSAIGVALNHTVEHYQNYGV